MIDFNNIDEFFKKFNTTEFVKMPSLTTEEADRLLFEGFLPMGDDWSNKFYIKLHFFRAFIYPVIVKPGKTVIRNSKKYRLSIDYDFEKVYNGINEQFHGICWFTKELYEVIKPLISNNNSLTSFHSIEIWNKNNEIVAGDIGVVSGSRYLSMTGYYSESGAGTVLLYSLGKLLNRLGFEVWDLGMLLPYKEDLGAQEFDREDFLKIIRETRNKKIELPKQEFLCEELIRS